jgi:hypothetical protein
MFKSTPQDTDDGFVTDTRILYSLLTPPQKETFRKIWEAEFSPSPLGMRPDDEANREQQPFDTNSDSDDDLPGDEWKKA